MNKTYRNLIMWALYAALFLAVIVLQTVVFGDLRIYGTKLSLIPVVIVCIAMHVEHEAAAFFCLGATLFWQASGADGGGLGIVTMTVCGILAAYLCDAVYTRHLTLALLFSVCAVLLHEQALFLLKCYLEQADWSCWSRGFVQAALAIPACPLIYFAAKLIRKAGAV